MSYWDEVDLQIVPGFDVFLKVASKSLCRAQKIAPGSAQSLVK